MNADRDLLAHLVATASRLDETAAVLTETQRPILERMEDLGRIITMLSVGHRDHDVRIAALEAGQARLVKRMRWHPWICLLVGAAGVAVGFYLGNR